MKRIAFRPLKKVAYPDPFTELVVPGWGSDLFPPPRPTLEQIHAALNKIVEDGRNKRAADRTASPGNLPHMEGTQFPHLVNYIPPGREKK